jgi:acyl-CoA synthetase (AMP-forming)/AMP-acid ligase II
MAAQVRDVSPGAVRFQTFRQVVGQHADKQPHATFLLAPESGAAVTYAELRRTTRRFGALLRGLRVPEQGIVAFMLPNGLAAATVFIGSMASGRIVSPINLLAQDAVLEYTLAHAAPDAIFVAPEFFDRLSALVARIGLKSAIVSTDPDRVDLPDDELDDGDSLESRSPAMLMYTSGTTGKPKGVLLSHANMLHAGRTVSAAHLLTPDDRVLSSLPLYHINGQCIGVVTPLVSGGSIVLPHRFSVSRWWPLVERYRPTWLNVVPTIIAYLLNAGAPTPAQTEALRGIRFARSASAPLPPEHHRAFEEHFGVPVIEAMGLTECASVAFCNSLDPTERRIGSPGRPIGMEARVVAPDGRVLAAGERGEIHLRGDNVMIGYYRAPDATAQAVDCDGWLSTGDLGYRDDEGRYFITGRLKELIIKGGENIAPREIDEALLAHPSVLEGAAVGVADPMYGQEILACVVLKPGFTCSEAALREHCERLLGRYKAPRYVRFVTELPKGPSGKVQRLRLADLAPSALRT